MMDRYAIVEGFYWYFVDYHSGKWSVGYRRLCKMQRYFKPSPIGHGPQTFLGKEVYKELVERKQSA